MEKSPSAHTPPINTTPPPAIATVGTFDGLHPGHQLVLDTLLAEARRRGLMPLAITFPNHPLDVVAPEKAPLPLCTPGEKMHRLRLAGANAVSVEFTPALARLTAREWLTRLRDKRGVRALVLGYDNTFGCDGRSMDFEQYLALGRDLGVDIIRAPEMPGVSSTAIRRAILSGDMEEAARLLSHPYTLEGTVAEGNKIGRTIGVPTANLKLPSPRMLPPAGVYVSEVTLPDGSAMRAITNIGTRPTLPDSLRVPEPLIETHIPGFSGNLYGKTISVALLQRIREERKFPGLDALKAQIAQDIRTALAPDGTT